MFVKTTHFKSKSMGRSMVSIIAIVAIAAGIAVFFMRTTHDACHSDKTEPRRTKIRDASHEQSRDRTLGVQDSDDRIVPDRQELSSLPEIGSKSDKDKKGVRSSKLAADEITEIQRIFQDIMEEGKAGKTSDKMIMLAKYPSKMILNVANQTMRFGNRKKKLEALSAIGAYYSRNSVNTPMMKESTSMKWDGSGESAAQGGASVPEKVDGEQGMEPFRSSEDQMASSEEMRTHDIVDVISAGLEDVDGDVRNVAAASILELPDEEYGILSSQLLSSENSDLKVEYIEEVTRNAELRSVSTLLQAMGDSTQNVRESASNGLKELVGQTFQSQDEALAWWEVNQATFGTNTKTKQEQP